MAPWQLLVSGPTFTGVSGAYNLDAATFANGAITGARGLRLPVILSQLCWQEQRIHNSHVPWLTRSLNGGAKADAPPC